MLRIAVCDDDGAMRTELQGRLREALRAEGRAAEICCFAGPEELLESGASDFDIYMLDVLMPGMDGIELGRRIRAAGGEGLIIYLTTSGDYAIPSYDVRAFHYLMKPLDPEKLGTVLHSALAQLERHRSDGFLVRTREADILMQYSRLMYAELRGRAIQYNLSDGGVVRGVTLRGSFREACGDLLRDPRFFMCGASWCVNLSFITGVERAAVTFTDGRRLELPLRAMDGLRARWVDFWLEG